MTKAEQKIKELESTIRNYDAMLESLKKQLAETKKQDPYGPVRKAWLVTMKTCTEPFAKYNKNINAYMEDPDLYKLEKDINKLQEIVFKTYENYKSYNSEKKIIKRLLKISKIEEKVLANPAYISQKYDDSMNVEKTLGNTSDAKTLLSELLITLKVQILPQAGLDKIADPA